MTPEEFAARRKALGSQEKVAAALGFGSGVHLSRIENGVRGCRRWHALAIRALEDHPYLLDPNEKP